MSFEYPKSPEECKSVEREERRQAAADARRLQALRQREWKRFGLAWLFWGVAGLSVNAVPAFTYEGLEEPAILAFALAFLPLLYFLVGMCGHRETWEGDFVHKPGNPFLPACVALGGFCAGHYLCGKSPELRSDMTAKLFILHALVVLAFIALSQMAKTDPPAKRHSLTVRKIGNVTGAIALLFVLLGFL